MTGGGAERVVSVISNHLAENGYEVTLLFTHSDECVYDLNPKIKTVLRDNVKGKDGINQIKFIRKWYKRDKKAVFVSFLRRQNMYSLIAAIGTNVKLVFSERNNPIEEFKLKNIYFYELMTVKLLSKLRQVKHIVFQTKGAMECYPKSVHKKSSIIYNPLKSGLPEPYTGERTKRIVAIGRINYQKNYPLLLRAFKKFSESHDDYKLEIYGVGGASDRLSTFISKLGIEDKVTLCGFSKNVHNDILNAGMFAMASRYEGLSNALLEAMAIGVPVISTDHPPGGAREFITSYENGILTENENVDEMYQAMCYMADNTDKASLMAQNATKIRKTLSADIICNEWKDVFDKLY